MAEIVSFYSYKGGVGRSISLANVAARLAVAGRRVACVDFDLEAGGLHTIFGLESKSIRYTLLDLLASLRTPDLSQAVIDLTGHLPPGSGGGQLLLLPTVSETDKVLRALDSSRDISMLLGNIVKMIEADYNPHYIFIDSRSGFAELASAPILRADRLVCVLRPNRQNADGLRILLDILATLPRSPSTTLVLSQVPDIPKAASRVEELERLLGPDRRFAALIPYAPDLALEESVVALKAPTSTLARCYDPIVEWLERAGNE